MVHPRSPGAWLLYAAYGCIALIALILVVALRMPTTGVHFEQNGAFIAVQVAGRDVALLKPDETVTFSTFGARLDQKAGELVSDYAPPSDLAGWYADRDKLARMAKAGRMDLQLPGRAPIRLTVYARSLLDLSPDVWLLLLQAAAIGLLGIWLGVLKPRDWGARLFMISCLGVALAAFSGAVFDARELTANGVLLQAMQGLNFIGSNICSTALLGVYLRQPTRLAPTWLAIRLVGLGIAEGVALGFGWLPLRVFYMGLIFPTLGFVLVLLAQWFRTRGDPAARASIAWVGTTTLLGMSILTLGMAAPQLLGLPSLAGDGMSFLPLFIVYGGIAFGVGGYRLFDLDRWTTRILLGVAATFGLLILDALLIGGIGLGGKLALALSILIIGFLYLPLRGVIWRWVAGRPAMSDSQLFQSAAEVAFSPAREDRLVRWRALLRRLFDPLELAVDETPGPEATLRDGGVALALPAIADDEALVLRYRDGGRRLFGADQQALARELVTLMRNAERTRDEYERGVRDERSRIARDLHDDVAARLLTSLHRQEVGEVRADVRKAMAEIRIIVSSLTGRQVSIEEAVADIRRETAERLEAAGLRLHWPVSLDAMPGQLSYRTYRHMASAHREVISNVLKHAGASTVTVTVDLSAERLSFSVHDDGRGLQPERRDGHGLGNMRARLAEVNGGLDLPACARGALVEMWAPVEAA